MRRELVHVFGSTKSLISSSDSDISKTAKENISEYISKSFRKKNFYKRFPIITWLPEYNITKFIADVIAGLTLGLTTIPQVLGVASVAEIPPQYGLYSAFVGSFIYIIFGSTKYITIGPTTTTAIVTLSYTKGLPPEYSVLLCFLTGVVTLLMSIVQLGFLVDFISTPVISAFTSAAAISIAATQLKGLLGLSFSANGFLEEIQGNIENITKIKWEDTVVALISLASLYFLMKIEVIFEYVFGKLAPKFKKFLWIISTSRSVAVVLIGTVIYGWRGDPLSVAVVGHVPSGLPDFKLPPFSYSETSNGTTVEFSIGSILSNNLSAFIVIPLVAFMEHVTICKAFGGSKRIDATQELFCLGLSNLIGSFLSSVPVTGAFGRTALNYASGAQSPLGGLLTGSIIILALLFLTPQFYYIPKPTLNSVVVMAVIFMIDFGILSSIWKTKKMDLVPWTVTFFVSLFLGLQYGIISGFIVSTVFLLYYAARPSIRVSKGSTSNGVDFLSVEIDRSVTFPSIEYVRYSVTKAARKWSLNENMTVVIDCYNLQVADYTSAKGLNNLIRLFEERKQRLIIWRLKASIRNLLEKFNSVEENPNNNSEFVEFCSAQSEDELEEILNLSPNKIFSI